MFGYRWGGCLLVVLTFSGCKKAKEAPGREEGLSADLLPSSGIEVVSATYGANCRVATGNVTLQLRAACNRREHCEYRVSVDSLGDPSPGCAKSFVVGWQCAGGPLLSASIPPEANGHRVTLGCGAAAAPAPAPAPRAMISILRASYGVNCGAPAGNATAPVAEACNGRAECDYAINAGRIGDPAFGCEKTFDINYQCGDESVSTIQVPKEAHGQSASISCR